MALYDTQGAYKWHYIKGINYSTRNQKKYIHRQLVYHGEDTVTAFPIDYGNDVLPYRYFISSFATVMWWGGNRPNDHLALLLLGELNNKVTFFYLVYHDAAAWGSVNGDSYVQQGKFYNNETKFELIMSGPEIQNWNKILSNYRTPTNMEEQLVKDKINRQELKKQLRLI